MGFPELTSTPQSFPNCAQEKFPSFLPFGCAGSRGRRVYMGSCVSPGAHAEVRRQLSGVLSHLPLRRSQGSKSNPQASVHAVTHWSTLPAPSLLLNSMYPAFFLESRALVDSQETRSNVITPAWCVDSTFCQSTELKSPAQRRRVAPEQAQLQPVIRHMRSPN